jgi:hypothetical protein
VGSFAGRLLVSKKVRMKVALFSANRSNGLLHKSRDNPMLLDMQSSPRCGARRAKAAQAKRNDKQKETFEF